MGSHQSVKRVRHDVSLFGLLMATCAMAAVAVPAQAATTDGDAATTTADGAQSDADAGQSTSSSALSEIIVTANRSGAQSLQKVPIAVSVVNVDQITKSGQGNLSDLAKFTPSLSITEGGPGFNKFNMRGLSTGGYVTSDTSDRSLVAIYLDDTPISVQGQTPDLKVYDLERVEILRGPQGTLYGAGSMAGTVRFVTAKPDLHDWFGSAESDVASTDHGSASFNMRAMINAPIISDQLAVRATGYVGHDGGFIDNIGKINKKNANYNDTEQARIALRWRPSDAFTLDAAFTYEKSHARGLNSAMSDLPAYTMSSNGPEGTKDLFRLYTLNGDYDLGFAHLVATGAYTDRKIGFKQSTEPTIGYFFQDYGSGIPVSSTSYPLYQAPTSYNQAITNLIPAELYTINQKLKDYMGEVRLVSNDDGPIKWTVGTFYEKQTRHLVQDIPTPGFDTLSYENFFYGPFNTPDGKYNSQLVDAAFQPNDIFSGLQDVHEHQIAVYGDATWHVTKKLDVTGGARYFHFKEDYFLFEGGVYGVIDHVPLTTNARLKSSGVNPRGNISYHVNDDLMLYAEAAKGFRYGGGNQPVPLGTTGVAGQCTQNLAAYGYTQAPLTFGPDKLWNYTIGEKAKLADGRVTFNASAYYIDWSDVQTRLRLDCSYFFTDNKGKITSKGVELETMVKVTPEITFSGSASYNDSKANGDIPTVGAFDGDRTPYFPRWTAALQIFYDKPMGDGSIHLQFGYQYQSKQFTTFNDFATVIVNGVLTKNGPNANFATIPASNNVSASISYDIGRLEIGVYGNNLANGVTVVNDIPATYYKVYQAGDRITYARPRTIGVRGRVKF